jgi:peptidyl-prolyl cis-trans isomerase B (cyclophilin B)
MKVILFALFIVASSFSVFADNDAVIAKKNPGKKPQYEITVTKAGQPLGKILIETFPQIAPAHCRNFDSLVSIGFYNGTKFHRVISGFMIQGGDPSSKDPLLAEKWGSGMPGQTSVVAEFSTDLTHSRGIISQARRGDNVNSGTSQFFICHADASFLDNQYSIWGRVVEGMEIVDIIAELPKNKKDRPFEDVEMTIKKVG